MNHKKNFIILGGSPEQYDYIFYLKKNFKYLNIICCDKNTNSYCKKISDQFFTIDIKDKKKILNLAKKLNIVGISSSITEHAIETIRYVSLKLNLPTTSKESIKATKSKFYCRKKINEKINFIRLKNFNKKIIRKFNKESEIIIKPDNGSGQKNLFKIKKNTKIDIIKKKFLLSKNFSKNKLVMIEKYILGKEINVVCLIINKKIHSYIYSLRKRYTSTAGFGVVYRHEFSFEDNLNIKNKIKEYIKKIIYKFNLTNAIIYPQFILDKNMELNLLEYGERIPGGKMRELFEYATGINLLHAQYKLSLNIKKIVLKKNIKKYKYISVDFLNGYPGPLKSGIVNKIKFSNTKKDNIIIDNDYFLPKINSPIKIKKIKSSSDRFYFFISASNIKYNFKKNTINILNQINFFDKNNKSMKKKKFVKNIL